MSDTTPPDPVLEFLIAQVRHLDAEIATLDRDKAVVVAVRDRISDAIATATRKAKPKATHRTPTLAQPTRKPTVIAGSTPNTPD